MLEGKLEQALEFADTTLPDGSPDFLLRLLVDRAEDKSIVSHLIVRIRDILLTPSSCFGDSLLALCP